MPVPRPSTNSWYRLSADEARSGYCIPGAVAHDARNAFYTDCERRAPVPADETYRFIGLVADGSDPDLVHVYPGYLSLADLFDLYGCEAVESENFNLLDVNPGIVSLNRELAAGLVTIFKEYASGMPCGESGSPCRFVALDDAEIARYRFRVFSGYTRTVYRLVGHVQGDETDRDITALVSLSAPTARPDILGFSVTRFSETAFRDDPEFNVLINGRGCIGLTGTALHELSALVEMRAACLVAT